jgi:hypothetical protein
LAHEERAAATRSLGQALGYLRVGLPPPRRGRFDCGPLGLIIGAGPDSALHYNGDGRTGGRSHPFTFI